MISLLTCTGDRPRLFKRLEDWMARQSLEWKNWVVVDDGSRPTQCTLGQRHLRLEPGFKPSVSFARNLQVGLREQARLAGSDFIFFIEDDDWYGPHYLASLLIALTSHELVGESHSRYYNVSDLSYHFCRNSQHAALYATAIRACLIPRIASLIDKQNIYFDRRIWEQLDCSKHLQPARHCVGLKGQTGRPGLGWGHRPSKSFVPDPQAIVLKEWLGGDASDALKYALNPGPRASASSGGI
jgi:hypothetical protein